MRPLRDGFAQGRLLQSQGVILGEARALAGSGPRRQLKRRAFSAIARSGLLHLAEPVVACSWRVAPQEEEDRKAKRRDGRSTATCPALPNCVKVPSSSGGGSFIEAAGGDSCRPKRFADGTWRCVPSRFPLVADFDLYYKSATCSGDLIHPWFNACPSTQRDPVGIIVQPFGCAQTVTDTLEFDGTVSSEGGLFHATPTVACQDSGFFGQPGSRWFRATKVVDPADLFIPLEQTVGD